jgi:dipeptidyl aminopeptidase/acylaminoacyl peptidase
MVLGFNHRLFLAVLFTTFVFAIVLSSTAHAVRRIPAEEFGMLPVLSQVRISPNGKAIAMLKPISGKNQLIILTLDGSAEPNSADVGEFEARAIRWINDDYVLVTATKATERVINGTHHKLTDSRLISVHRTDPDKTKIMMKPENGVGVLQGGRETWKPNQGSYYHLLPDDPDHFLAAWEDTISKVNIRTGKHQSVFTLKSFHTRNLVPDMSGQVRIRTSSQNNVFYRNKKGFWKEIHSFKIDTDENHGFGQIAFEKNPRYALVKILDENEDREMVVRVDFERDKILNKVFHHDFVDVDYISYNLRNQQVYGINYTVDRMETFYLDPVWEARHKTLERALLNQSPTIINSSQDLTKHIVVAESPFVPVVYYLYDETKEKLSAIGRTRPQFKSDELAEMRAIQYQARDGQTIRGYLTLPLGADAKNLPMVTMPHGGPQARDVMRFDYLAQFFANRGYAVFQPNFRGSDGYGDIFADAGKGEWGGLMSDDVTDGVKKLIELGVANPARMCIVGWSYGGYAALIATVVTPELYNCAVSINGVSDLPDMMDYETKGNFDSYYSSRDYWTAHIGHRYKDRERLIQGSAARQVDKIKMPILLIHAETDRIVPVEQSRKMERVLKEAGKPVRFVEFEGGDHGLTYEKSRVTLMKELDSFLAEYMK